jgi:hypothetical protein
VGLPVFVVTQRTHTLRDVHRGWIMDWDDSSRLFLISFGDAPLPGEQMGRQLVEDTPFSAFDDRPGTPRAVKSRPGQQRFKFAVFKRYGPQCGVCSVAVVDLLQAAHIIPKDVYGSDDARNGLVLCANHHLAYDAGLFTIDPDDLTVWVKPDGPTSQALGLMATHLRLLRASPHVDALRWRFSRWMSAST